MSIDFNKGDGLVPVIIQDDRSLQVLMLAYMNQAAYTKTLETNQVTFYSRSKGRLWTKGEESGNYLQKKSIEIDCDKDTLLIKSVPSGPVCHKGTKNCFGVKSNKGFIYELEEIIQQRINDQVTSSYTNKLYEKGINKVAQKVGEEAIELIIEAKDDNDDLFKEEAADLLYHFLILLKAKGMKLEDIENVLQSRS